MKEQVTELVSKYGWFIIGGLIGAVIQRIRNSMSLRRFMGVLAISGFVGVSVGIIMRNYFNASEEVIFVACSISGVFSQDILNELQKIINLISVVFKSKAGLSKEEENEDD